MIPTPQKTKGKEAQGIKFKFPSTCICKSISERAALQRMAHVRVAFAYVNDYFLILL